MMIRTKFHDIFQTKLPIIQAGMGPYDTTKLAGAVAKTGGIGDHLDSRHGHLCDTRPWPVPLFMDF